MKKLSTFSPFFNSTRVYFKKSIACVLWQECGIFLLPLILWPLTPPICIGVTHPQASTAEQCYWKSQALSALYSDFII